MRIFLLLLFLLIVLSVLFGVKAVVAMLFLGSMILLCLWINRKARASGPVPQAKASRCKPRVKQPDLFIWDKGSVIIEPENSPERPYEGM